MTDWPSILWITPHFSCGSALKTDRTAEPIWVYRKADSRIPHKSTVRFKGKFHPKKRTVSSFTHSHVVLNPYDWLPSVDYKRRHFIMIYPSRIWIGAIILSTSNVSYLAKSCFASCESTPPFHVISVFWHSHFGPHSFCAPHLSDWAKPHPHPLPLFYLVTHFYVSLILLGVVRLERESELSPVSCRIHSSVWFIPSVVHPTSWHTASDVMFIQVTF